jgi:hypothetical protein
LSCSFMQAPLPEHPNCKTYHRRGRREVIEK